MFDEILAIEFWQQHRLLLMFASAFLSATVLPGNSELVFIGLAGSIQLSAENSLSVPILTLLLSAIVGNSLGSASTYWIGRWFPPADVGVQNSDKKRDKKILWVFSKIEKYGALALLLSWLPVVGDIFCAAAGWLRLNWVYSLIYIVIGKTLRYAFLLYWVTGYTFL